MNYFKANFKNIVSLIISETGGLIPNNSSTKDVVNLTCSILFQGNWAPTVEWKEQGSHDEKVISVGVNTSTVLNKRVTSTLVMTMQKGNRNYTCTTKFDISGKPSYAAAAAATNIPDHKESWTFAVFNQSEGVFGQIMQSHCLFDSTRMSSLLRFKTLYT